MIIGFFFSPKGTTEMVLNTAEMGMEWGYSDRPDEWRSWGYDGDTINLIPSIVPFMYLPNWTYPIHFQYQNIFFNWGVFN